MRKNFSRFKSSSSTSDKITSILEKAEKERDEALSDLRKARFDIQTLRNTIQVRVE